MGGCVSGDLKGGKQAIGGVHGRSTMNNDAGYNEAIDHFFRVRDQSPLFTPIELSLSASNLRNLDILSKALKLNEQDFLGEATCVLSEIVTKRNQSLTLNLHGKNGPGGSKNFGTLTVHAEESCLSRMAVEMKLRCSQLGNKDMFSKSDPFLRISRLTESGKYDNPLLIECFNFNSNGNHVLIGQLHKSVSELEKLHKERSGANLVFPTHRGQEKVLKGQLFVDQFIGKEQFSFLDYISSGFELNFMVAVDFTASNGTPRNQDSLHYIDPSGRLNSYQKAIIEAGEVIQFYDSDRRFPAWGFGGRYGGTLSHCFNLNGTNAYEVEGVQGIMAAYANALHTVTLAGPTLFGPDGVLTDIEETMDALVRASDLPLSILIVGVGNADFKQMEFWMLMMDVDWRVQQVGLLHETLYNLFLCEKCIVSGQISAVQALLEELPDQFLTYNRSRNIKPLHS
ncbi:hypothetical protein GOBAR_DD11527 [Gossypium barbadense]|nr:hypothetical protein GOBAR_DD11527 [Gossypium barbadense]